MDKFPYLIDGASIPDPDDWIKNNLPTIERALEANGAVLFRNFSWSNKHDLQKVMKLTAKAQNLLDYTGGTSPRKKLADGIYTSTKMPFFLKIPLHSEMAYRNRFPKKIAFFCEKAPLIGGETPIVDLRKVQSDIPAEIRMKLQNGIIYYRHLKNYTPMRRFLSRLNPMIETGTWQFVFNTNDKKVVDQYCKENAFQTEWLADGSVILKTHLPSLKNNIWFNSVHFFQVHPRIWGSLLTMVYKFILIVTKGQDLSAKTGSGERLSKSEISAIVDAYEKNQTAFKWVKGDLLLLNNTLTAHGRNPYLGTRSILVSMAEEDEFTSLKSNLG